MGGYYWPADLPRVEALPAFVELYRQLGYEECDGPDFEPGREKIALYVDAGGVPTHAARQLSDGTWTSKLGGAEDIRHPTLTSIADGQYGTAVVFMSRLGTDD